MNDLELKKILSEALENCEIEIQIDGNKVNLDLVSSSFSGLTRVKRQQLVYGFLKDKIASGEIHAVMMRTVTPEENTRS